MVIESILNTFKIKKYYANLIFVGFLYTSLSIFLSFWVFKEYSSLLMVFFTVMSTMPFVYKIMSNEEKYDLTNHKQINLLKHHSKAILKLTYLFLGLTFAFSFWYILLPSQTTSYLYNTQSQTIVNINNEFSAKFVDSGSALIKIISNNLKVLSFTFLFSFIYGLGGIFILTWNSSVIGTALGTFIRSSFINSGNYLSAISLSLLRYLLHGIPEVVAYFLAGLAGGILSISFVNYDFRTKSFEKILLDSTQLIILGVFIVIIAGLIEVYITPLFF